MEQLDEMADRRVITFNCRDQPINVRITSPTFLASCRALSKLLVRGPGEGFLLLESVWAPDSLGAHLGHVVRDDGGHERTATDSRYPRSTWANRRDQALQIHRS
jgi:hypothetical protein